MGLAVGRRPPGLAHRVLRDGGEGARPGVLDPRRRARPRLPAPRERAGAVAAVGHPFARVWMHNGMLRFTGEKMSKSLGNVATIREVLDRWGRGDGARLLPHCALAQADRLLRRDDGGGRGAGRDAAQRAARRDGGDGRLGGVRRRARGRLQHACCARGVARLARAGALGELRRGARRLRARARSARSAPRRPRSSSSPRRARARGSGGTSPRPTGCATRSRRRLGRARRGRARLRARPPRA